MGKKDSGWGQAKSRLLERGKIKRWTIKLQRIRKTKTRVLKAEREPSRPDMLVKEGNIPRSADSEGSGGGGGKGRRAKKSL